MGMPCLKIKEPEHVNEPQCMLHNVWPQKKWGFFYTTIFGSPFVSYFAPLNKSE
jgi:hypothetical protein